MAATLAPGPLVFVLLQLGERLAPAVAVALGLPLLGVGALLLFQLAVLPAVLVDVWRVPVPAAGLPSLVRSGAIAAGALAVSLVAGGTTTALFRAYYVEAYRLPAGSMMPALLVGDHFLVSKFAYRHRDPARGDVVVFEYPVDPERDFIKRVIGLPGETIHVRDRQISVNCAPGTPGCQPIEDPWGFYEDPQGRGDSRGKWEIPAGSYFVLGDNRNNSQDSRFWGFVERDKIKGKAFLVYWSRDPNHDDTSLWERVRWGRLCRLIR
jgi:signal peptidase I